MNQLFTHYLITRYNVPLEGWEVDKEGISTRDGAWLSHRLSLFTKYCIPTVVAQTEKNFTWLIYCAKNTPEDALKEIYNSLHVIPHSEIRLVTGYHDCMADIDQTLSKAATPFVITSRLDNDDGIGKDYIKMVQKHFIPYDGTILNLLHGHGYHPLNKVSTLLWNMQMNHFTSLIEKTKPGGGHMSIRGFQHHSPPSHFQLIDLPVKNAWLKIFHERNLKSSIFGYPNFMISLKKLYGIEKNDSEININHTIRYLIWWLRDGYKRKIKRSTSK